MLSPNLFVDNDTHCPLSNIVHSTRLPVVELMRHAFVEGAMTLDVHYIANLVHLQVRRQVLGPWKWVMHASRRLIISRGLALSVSYRAS